MLYVVDSGRSIVDQALRVSSKHQGKGIASLLIDRGMKHGCTCNIQNFNWSVKPILVCKC